MKVRTLKEIPSAKGTIPAGKIIDIPPEALSKLAGFVQVVTNNPSLLVGIRTGAGRKVYVATDDKAAKIAPEGAALFTRQEIIALADKLIDVKEVFPGAVIEKIGEDE